MAHDFDERLIWLLRVSRNMLATRDLDRLLALITDAFVEATEADRGILLLKNDESGHLEQQVARNAAGKSIERAETRISTIANRVFRDQKPVFATDTGAEDDLATRRSIDELKLKMMVCVPLATETERFGVIYADGRTSLDRVFTNTNRNTFEMLADHAAAAIENARLFERATNDPLTGLPNNSYFMLELGKSLKHASNARPLGVLLIDIDSFKRVNHAAGAEAGDQALIDIATTIKDTTRTDGLVARYGSDKFAILLPSDDEKIELRIRDVAERVRAVIGAKSYHDVRISCCIGGAGFPRPGVETGTDLVAIADDALASARERGRGEVEFA